MTSRMVLERARKIVLGGGDKDPCANGPFCLACCCAIAKTQLDDENGTGCKDTMLQVFVTGIRIEASDAPLLDAMNRLRQLSKRADTILTQKESLALLVAALTAPLPKAKRRVE